MLFFYPEVHVVFVYNCAVSFYNGIIYCVFAQKPLNMDTYPLIVFPYTVWLPNHTFLMNVLLIEMILCVIIMTRLLKLPSLFTAWLFWTLHTKSHNMKALVILNHSRSPFLPLTCLYGINELLRPSGVFSWEKISPQITLANHMTMTTSEQF